MNYFSLFAFSFLEYLVCTLLIATFVYFIYLPLKSSLKAGHESIDTCHLVVFLNKLVNEYTPISRSNLMQKTFIDVLATENTLIFSKHESGAPHKATYLA